MAGKADGVARVMGGIVQSLVLGKAHTKHKKASDEKTENAYCYALR